MSRMRRPIEEPATRPIGQNSGLTPANNPYFTDDSVSNAYFTDDSASNRYETIDS